MTTYLSLLAVFTTSLLGSLHCVGMCGGFISLYSLGTESPLRIVGGHERFARELAFHALYNTGRLAAYLTLGAVAGTLGGLVNQVFELGRDSAGIVQNIVGFVAGILIILWGTSVLVNETTHVNPPLGKLARAIGSFYQRFANDKLVNNAPFLLGVLSGILPCGWLYAFVALAWGTASPLLGSLVMGAFWMGTVPAMLLGGLVVLRITQRLRRFAPVATALLMIVLGIFTLSGKFASALDPHQAFHTHQSRECSP